MNPEWRADPTGRHQLRWHDGDQWTDHVADGQETGTDPYTPSTGSSTDWPAPSAGSSAGAYGDSYGAYDDAQPPGRSTTFASPQEQTRRGVRVGWVVAIAVVTAIVAGAIGFFIGLAVGASSTFIDGIQGGFDAGIGDGFVPEEESLEGATPGDPLELGGTVTGNAADAGVVHDLVLEADTSVQLTVTEGGFDTEMIVFDETGAVLASDDDGGVDLLSQLVLDVGPGTYQVVVRPLSGFGPGGEYTLAATEL